MSENDRKLLMAAIKAARACAETALAARYTSDAEIARSGADLQRSLDLYDLRAEDRIA